MSLQAQAAHHWGAAARAGLALLLATSFLMPVSQPPVVTAIGELWAVAVAGVACIAMGLWAWRQAPLAIAGFPTPRADEGTWPRLLLVCLAVAALVSAALAVLQVLAPQVLASAPGSILQGTHLPGRAVAHLRQPNHLATLLVWGSIAWVVMTESGAVRPIAAWAGQALLMWGVVLTGSRTGLLALVLLVAWGALDRRLSRLGRAVLLASPILAVVAWGAMQVWAGATESAFGASDPVRVSTGGDISSSRFAIWRNTWALILQHPWTGVGWGNFNIAWTLTPFPDRPTALFDHAHNLPLHLMVECGIPLGLSATLLLVAAVAHAGRRAWGDAGPWGVWRRGAFMLLPIVGLHSLLEYPLWYSYFALPTLAALMVAGGWDRAGPRSARWKALGWIVGGSVLTVLSVWAFMDYQKIRAIYAPRPSDGPLAARMAQGQDVTWFAAHAHYALATNVRPIPGRPWTPALERAFEGAPHVLLDTRLMTAWAEALAARNGPGDVDKARHLAARLREFKPAAAATGIGNCGSGEVNPPAPEAGSPAATAQGSGSAPAWACEAPRQAWSWRALIEIPDHSVPK